MEQEEEFGFERFKQEPSRDYMRASRSKETRASLPRCSGHFLEAAMAGELEAHLQEEKAAGKSNRKNGKTSKKVKSLSGEFELETSRDRSGSFQPMVVPKRQLIITAELEEKVIGLYGLGLQHP